MNAAQWIVIGMMAVFVGLPVGACTGLVGAVIVGVEPGPGTNMAAYIGVVVGMAVAGLMARGKILEQEAGD